MKDGKIDYDAPIEDRPVISGGACTECPRNTRNMGDDAKGVHMCMLPECYRKKQNAAHERWRESVKPHGTLSLEENDALWAPSGEALAFHSPYVEIDEKPHDLDLKPTAVCDKTWRKLIKGREVETVAGRDAKGKTHIMVKKEVAIAAAVENQHHIFRKEPEAAATAGQTQAQSEDGIPAVDAAANAIQRESEDAEKRAADDAKEEERHVVWVSRVTALVDGIVAAKDVPHGFLGNRHRTNRGAFHGRPIADRRAARDRSRRADQERGERQRDVVGRAVRRMVSARRLVEQWR